MRPLPPLRLGVLPPIADAGRGLVVGLPLTTADLTNQAGVARSKVMRALESARRSGLTVVALGGLLAQPWWSALIAREGRVRTITGEGLAIVAVVDALGVLAGPRLTDWRVGVVVGPGGRLAAETLAVWLARVVGQVALFGPRPVLEGIADRILGDSGLVAEVNAAPLGPSGRGNAGPGPLDAVCLFGPLPLGSGGAVGDETVVIDLSPGPGTAALALGPGCRVHRVSVAVPWPGRVQPRAARLFPAEGGSAGSTARLLPTALGEVILEAGSETGPTQPTLRRVERLAALARRRKMVAGRLSVVEPAYRAGPG
ncbi:MAG: hypothetical protein ACYC6V_03150 [Bacillota bacterium]